MTKRSITCIFALIMLPLFAFTQMGTVIDTCTVYSKILGMNRKYSIYLPPDYNNAARAYPVLYLLHGATDDNSGWVQFGEVQRITDEAIKTGVSAPMVIIMPDADSGVMGYSNSANGKWRYEDFFFEELIPAVEKRFKIKSAKRYRAVAGLSMGGGGSFMYALHRPDMFSSSCPLSAYVGPLDTTEMKSFVSRPSTKDASDQQLMAWFDQYSIVNYIKNSKDEKLKSVNWYIDCGDDDFLFEGNSLIHIAFKKRNIPHEYRVRDGGHSWSYWRTSLPHVLSFVSDTFRQK
jgi:enterochelin esterase-like enzyme